MFTLLRLLLLIICLGNAFAQAQTSMRTARVNGRDEIKKLISGRTFGIGISNCDPYTYSEYWYLIRFSPSGQVYTKIFSSAPMSYYSEFRDTGVYSINERGVRITMQRGRYTYDTFSYEHLLQEQSEAHRVTDSSYRINRTDSGTFLFCDGNKLQMNCSLFTYGSEAEYIVRLPDLHDFEDDKTHEKVSINLDTDTAAYFNPAGKYRSCRVLSDVQTAAGNRVRLKIGNSAQVYTLEISEDRSYMICTNPDRSRQRFKNTDTITE